MNVDGYLIFSMFVWLAAGADLFWEKSTAG
jgi:hypothetical protein